MGNDQTSDGDEDHAGQLDAASIIETTISDFREVTRMRLVKHLNHDHDKTVHQARKC